MKIMHSIAIATFICFSAVFAGSLYSRVSDEVCEKPAIVFDLGGVLFDTDESVFIKDQLGRWNALRYWARHGSKKIRENWYSALKNASIHNEDSFGAEKEDGSKVVVVKDEHGNELPDYMVEWLSGARSNQKLFDVVCTGIQAQKLSKADKAFMVNMTKNFLPDYFVASRKVIKEMIPLVEKLKEEGFPLLILSNWDKESFELMRKAYSEIFALFDGCIVSGYEQLVKPDPEIYHRCEQRYPYRNYIFADDQKDNRIAAKACGWKTIAVASGKPDIKQIEKNIMAHTAACQEAAYGIA